jgi:hypothetical protein
VARRMSLRLGRSTRVLLTSSYEGVGDRLTSRDRPRVVRGREGWTWDAQPVYEPRHTHRVEQRDSPLPRNRTSAIIHVHETPAASANHPDYSCIISRDCAVMGCPFALLCGYVVARRRVAHVSPVGTFYSCSSQPHTHVHPSRPLTTLGRSRLVSLSPTPS